MAQLYKRPNSPYWWGKFQLGGKLHRFSTERKKRSDAQTVLANRISSEKGELSVDTLLNQLVAAVAKLPKSRQNEVSLTVARRLACHHDEPVEILSAWKVWQDSPRSRSPGKNTLVGYHAIFSRFEKWASKRKPPVKQLHEVTQAIADTYATDLRAANFSSRTFNAHVSFLQSMFHALRNRAGLTENVWAEIPRLEGAPRGRRELTPDELVKIIAKASGALRTLILIGAYTGMRLGDACLLTWENVRLKDGLIEYVPMKTARKGKRIRIPLSQHLAGWLRGLHMQCDGRGYVIPDIAAEYKAERSRVTRTIQAHFTACGIATHEAAIEGKPRKKVAIAVGFHSLRHSFVSLCAANRVPQVAIMEMVGHGSPAMTRLYSHAGEEQKRQAVDALPALIPCG